LTTALNAIMLGLLATPSIPLRTTVSTMEVVKAQSVVICHPTEAQRQQATSTHVLAFDNNSRELVLCESWGNFTAEEWDEIIDAGEKDRAAEDLLRNRVAKMLNLGNGGPTI
jgi:ribonuclease PH